LQATRLAAVRGTGAAEEDHPALTARTPQR
jgi:hypothetical protein